MPTMMDLHALHDINVQVPRDVLHCLVSELDIESRGRALAHKVIESHLFDAYPRRIQNERLHCHDGDCDRSIRSRVSIMYIIVQN